MRAALAVLVLLCGAGCVRASEGTVREKAGAAFACADYELTVVEVGPDLYRASGCGQELIYACRSTGASRADQPTARQPSEGSEPVVVCARTPE